MSTPTGVVEKLANDLARARAAPDLRDQLAKLGAEPMSMTHREFPGFVRAESEDAARVIKAAAIKAK
jgi:tripartite-type tricarboxylate transporter receptor subunit TctC